MTRITGAEGVLNAFEAPVQKGPPASKIEPKTCKIWSIVSIVHVVVPSGVPESWEAKAKTWRASSRGKFWRENAADWYTSLAARGRIAAAMRAARSTRKVVAGVQKKPKSRASRCIWSSLTCYEVACGFFVGISGFVAGTSLASERRDALRGCTTALPAKRACEVT